MLDEVTRFSVLILDNILIYPTGDEKISIFQKVQEQLGSKRLFNDVSEEYHTKARKTT